MKTTLQGAQKEVRTRTCSTKKAQKAEARRATRPMEKIRIGALSKQLDLKQFVIRYWEREFNVKPKRSQGRQRYYTKGDIEKLKIIKMLLYEKKFTISGAKQFLKQKDIKYDDLKGNIIAATKASLDDKKPAAYTEKASKSPTQYCAEDTEFNQKICELRKQLKKLSAML